MKENTTTYLNTKIWYRFLKIIYVFIFISALAYGVMWLIEEHSPYETVDRYKSLIVCNSGNTYTFSEVGNVSDDIAMKELCLSPAEKIIRKEQILNGGSGFQAFLERKGLSSEPNLLAIPINYKIQTVYKTIGGWHLVFGYFLLWILIICVALEIIKRAFYYIVLGKINPPKK